MGIYGCDKLEQKVRTDCSVVAAHGCSDRDCFLEENLTNHAPLLAAMVCRAGLKCDEKMSINSCLAAACVFFTSTSDENLVAVFPSKFQNQ